MGRRRNPSLGLALASDSALRRQEISLGILHTSQIPPTPSSAALLLPKHLPAPPPPRRHSILTPCTPLIETFLHRIRFGPPFSRGWVVPHGFHIRFEVGAVVLEGCEEGVLAVEEDAVAGDIARLDAGGNCRGDGVVDPDVFVERRGFDADCLREASGGRGIGHCDCDCGWGDGMMSFVLR